MVFDRRAFPVGPPHRPGSRPPIPPRPCFEAVLWLLRYGGRWQDCPESGPSKSTCQRRLAEWIKSGILTEVWSRLVDLADELGWIDWSQLIADGAIYPAKSGRAVRRGPQGKRHDGSRVDGQRPHSAGRDHRRRERKRQGLGLYASESVSPRESRYGCLFMEEEPECQEHIF